MNNDLDIRLEAFNWLKEKVELFDGILTRDLLQKGFYYKNQRIPLVAPNGIFTPRIMEFPLTITTISDGPYNDEYLENCLLYKYRGSDPYHRDNVALRNTIEKNIPVIYLNGILPNKYIANWPAFIIDDLQSELTFKVTFDDISHFNSDSNKISEDPSPRRAYITSTVKRRLHQKSFRERVLYAYRTQCSLCRLKHRELLDAAHIIPDSDAESKPTVDNGISLCKIHHACFDNYFIGISPEYKLNVREDILMEINGPMLQHGLKDLHNISIQLPSIEKYKPNKDYLDFRYQKFLNSC